MSKDIRVVKKNLRSFYKQMRMDMPIEKKQLNDKKIYHRLINLWAYRNSKTVLTYVSTKIEVDTTELIRHALSHGKKVAVPCCTDREGNMAFYYIDGLDELEKGLFGVLEPKPCESRILQDEGESVCIIPAFSFDKKGFRLGYGKGYYDRFLSGYSGNLVGICYQEGICESLPHGRFDKPVHTIVTDRGVRIVKP